MTLDERIREIHTTLGSRASTDQVVSALATTLTSDERDTIVARSLKVAVSRALRVPTEYGVAFAQAIKGQYVQLSIMDESEYRACVKQHVGLRGAHDRIASRYVALCGENLGIDISDELDEAAS